MLLLFSWAFAVILLSDPLIEIQGQLEMQSLWFQVNKTSPGSLELLNTRV